MALSRGEHPNDELWRGGVAKMFPFRQMAEKHATWRRHNVKNPVGCWMCTPGERLPPSRCYLRGALQFFICLQLFKVNPRIYLLRKVRVIFSFFLPPRSAKLIFTNIHRKYICRVACAACEIGKWLASCAPLCLDFLISAHIHSMFELRQNIIGIFFIKSHERN